MFKAKEIQRNKLYKANTYTHITQRHHQPGSQMQTDQPASSWNRTWLWTWVKAWTDILCFVVKI